MKKSIRKSKSDGWPPLYTDWESLKFLVGEVVINWSRIEVDVKKIVGKILFNDDLLGANVFATIHFKMMLGIFTRSYFARVKSERLDKRLERLIKDLLNVYEHRNTIAHSVWSVSFGEDSLTLFKLWRKKNKTGIARVDKMTNTTTEKKTLGEMRAVLKQIEQVRKDFVLFRMAIDNMSKKEFR